MQDGEVSIFRLSDKLEVMPSFPYIESISNATVVLSAFKAMRKPLVRFCIT